MSGQEIPLASVMEESELHSRDVNSNILIEFTDHLVGLDTDKLADSRQKIIDTLGYTVLVEAAATVATFSLLDRIANATGIPLETEMVKMSADFRESLGINNYYSAGNTLKS